MNKYIKLGIYRVILRPSYIWDARFLKVNAAWRRTETSFCATLINEKSNRNGDHEGLRTEPTLSVSL